ncbi:hypothetical protein DERP_007677 [Dermatophagoides pteronyssinus]|uniref:Uncharacterized protein n=1 Tax=Dermatophagoides pteronyssinus TaxID=6956 RepID=A0ABQ8JKF1_DERPT|nr:hypothetical protein DERP_007677 [Dermatophagoides pteronyssinus]
MESQIFKSQMAFVRKDKEKTHHGPPKILNSHELT